MNTNQIKKFAIEARNILKKGIKAKIQTLGFDDKGQVSEQMMPQLLQGGTVWNGRQYTEGFYHQWMALYNRVLQKGILEVYEEAAYTWFNRLVAIRILQKNGFCEPVLVYTDTARTPRIVDEARMGRLPQMQDDVRRNLMELLEDDTKVTEQFAMLITAWCHQNPIIRACFGSMEDFTELLLPVNILAEGGFVDLLNHTEFITDDDFRSPELIGWLYQFYISERKDEVFAKKGKFEADEIPAATQIFTPNWIVKYMVQNTVGRIYLDNNSGIVAFRDKWKYLVDQEPIASENIYHYDELTDLKVADLACGSGHILNECFDLLYDLYIYEGYNRSEAVKNIFKYNLTGIDIDTRAKQLAMFSLLMKACQKDISFADAHCLPRILAMPNCDTYTWKDLGGHLCCALGLHMPSERVNKELIEAFTLLHDANNLGSIMKFDICDDTKVFIHNCIDEQNKQHKFENNFKELFIGFHIILALTTKYTALVMNPPYMGGGNMNNLLSKYVKDNYEDSKSDLFSVFMEVAIERMHSNGKYGMINMQSWMFLSSFEKLRKKVLNNEHIDSMLHLGPRTFDELSGEVVQNTAFVISKNHQKDNQGTYFRLVDGKNCGDKEQIFLFYSDQGAKIYYPNIPQSNFEKIPGCPMGYWLTSNQISTFKNQLISDIANPKAGLATGNNDVYMHLWSEVNLNNIGKNYKSAEDTQNSNERWFPCLSGGHARKWSDYIEYVVDWKNNGYNLKHFFGNNGKLASRPQNTSFYFKEGLTWNKISSNYFSVRYKRIGSIFDDTSRCAFVDNNISIYYLLGFLCSAVSLDYLRLFNPTMSFTNGDIQRIPIINGSSNSIDLFVRNNIDISRQDWDAHETSWDFQANELLAIDESTYMDNIHNEIEAHFKDTGEHICIDPAAPQLDSLEWRMEQYKQKWEHKFMQLHSNEEELNRQFIEIYDLQDELTPDVPLSEITILQQGEISIETIEVNAENEEADE